ncbi:MAG: sulfatase [Bacteroidota bacterium]
MKNLLVLSIFSCFLLLTCTPSDVSQSANRLPNIIIIFTDDQGYQDLGCYGSPDIRTPHLDRMAAEGLRLTNFYVSQPVCSASRASLLTGCYANRIGIHGAFMPKVGKGLHPDETTIAEMLKPLGYATAIYGKWHLGNEKEFLPTRQGFDEYLGIPYSNDMWPLHPWQGTHFNFPALPLMENEEVIDTLTDQRHLTRLYTERAVDFIHRNKEKPFFLYLPHSMPHVPLYASEAFRGQSKGGLYGDVIEEIDWSTGEVLKALREAALDENSLVVFTSDNGPWLSYGAHAGVALPLREGKGTTWEGGVRVPCIMRWPGRIAAGQLSDRPAMTIDLLPTIAHLTNAPLPERKIDGRDMSHFFEPGNRDQAHHDYYCFYYNTNELHSILSGDGRWKLQLPHTYRSLNGRSGREDGLPIEYDQNETGLALYDLVNDVGEQTDVSKAHPEIVATMLGYAEQSRAELGDRLTQREGSELRPVGQIAGQVAD